jgi:hypothetical protein
MSCQPHYFVPEMVVSDGRRLNVDVCVYGGTAAGVVAAVTAANRGKRVVLLHPGVFLGGMTSGGLSYTDLGNPATIGGRAREFYRAAGRHYGMDECWTSEPGVARRILEGWLEDADVGLVPKAFLDRVQLEGNRIRSVRMLGGLEVWATAFIDATYEGDLLAGAGVSFTVGREGNLKYGETLNGAQIHQTHQFDYPVDPYRKEGVPSSGLLPGVEAEPSPRAGQGDDRIQAYCFRVCLTRVPDRRIDFPQPEGWNREDYLLLERWLRGTPTSIFDKFDRIQGEKTDTNNHGAVSTDFIGGNYGWPRGNYRQREAIFQEHIRYQQGLHWFMAFDPAVPAHIREEYAGWGLAADEFEETGNWPHQLYIREGRRMLGDYVITEHDCMTVSRCDDPVAMGAYQMDSHNCRRCVRDGAVVNEGDVQFPITYPYPISYRAIIPRRGEVENLAVPVSVSASHIAFGSIRMEPVFMMLAESAAIAACLALEIRCAMQELPYSELKSELMDAGQVLSCEKKNRGDGNPATIFAREV